MKNREMFKEELREVVDNNLLPEFVRKHNIYESWATHITGRMLAPAPWLDEEYQEPEVDWSKVNVDDPILVRDNDDEEWNQAHFACYEDGKVHAWSGGKTSWTAKNYLYWMQAKLAEPQKPEHDSCVGCKFEHFASNQEPCKDCQHAHMDKYEPKEEIR